MERGITKREGERNPKQTNNAQLLPTWTDAQPVSKDHSAAPCQVLPVYILGMMFSEMGFPFGQFQSAFLAVAFPRFFCTCSVADDGKLKNLDLGKAWRQLSSGTAKPSLCYQHYSCTKLNKTKNKTPNQKTKTNVLYQLLGRKLL